MTHSACVIRLRLSVILRAMGFLQVLRPEDRIALTNAGRPRSYRRGATIIMQGERTDTVFVLTSGWVKITHDTPSGREIVLSVLGPGDVLGDWEAIDPAIGPRLAGNVALEPVECRVLGADEFTDFLRERPGAALALLRITIHRLAAADRRRVEAGSLDVVHRLARFLLELAEQYGRGGQRGIDIDLPLTQDELASVIAASRESVVRALTTLRSGGLHRHGQDAGSPSGTPRASGGTPGSPPPDPARQRVSGPVVRDSSWSRR